MEITLVRIIDELKAQGKRQSDLTEYLGVSDSCFGNWKKGLNQSYLKYLHAIADFLGVSVEYLRGETEQKEKPPIVENERLKELYELTSGLSDTDIIALKSFVAGLKANH